MSSGQRRLIQLASLLTGVVLCLAALAWLPGPFVWIGLVAAGTMAVLVAASQSPRARLTFLVLGSLAAGLGVAELALGALRRSPDWPVYTEPYHARGEFMWKPVPGAASRSSRLFRGDTLFNVVYTIGADGLRMSPPPSGAGPHRAVLFFGCSFMYGEGLSDQETLPYQVGLLTGGTWRTLNFAYHGYGPHHMLLLLEQGRVGQLVNADTVRQVIYGMIPEHVRRVAGRVWWGQHAPRYVLDAQGTPRLHGRFVDGVRPPGPLMALLGTQLGKSALYRLVSNTIAMFHRADMRFFTAVVTRSRDLVRREFPQARFHVLLWPDHGGLAGQVLEYRIEQALAGQGIPVHAVRRILPDFEDSIFRYYIPHDGHPSAEAHAQLARYVVATILQPDE
jgi:hypothetical protein